MRRLRTTLMGLGVAAVIFGGGAWGVNWWQIRQLVVSTDNAYVRGNVAAIASMVAGYIEDIHVTSHQKVRAGEPLLTIRGDRYEAAVDSARAELRAAAAEVEIGHAAVEHMLARRRLQKSLIDQATARVEAAKARVEAAEAQVDHTASEAARYSELLERQTGSRQKYEAAVTAHRLAQAEINHARAEMNRAQAELLAARDQVPVFDSEIRRLQREIDRLEALVAQAASALDAAEIALSDTLVTAPVDGVIGNLRVEPGMYTEAGWPVMAVVPLYDTYIVANFKETQLERLRSGQQVRIEIDAFPGVALTGTLDSLAPASAAEFSLLPSQNATGNFVKVVQRVPVKILYTVPDDLAGRVVPGMSVVITVDTRSAPHGAALADDGAPAFSVRQQGGS